MSELKISEMIRELRTDRGISQETLADVCGVSMQAVSKWENGQSCPDIAFLPQLAEYFGVSVDYLLSGQNHITGNPDDNITASLSEQALKDDALYIIQYRNGKILNRQRWNTEQPQSRDMIIRIQFDDEFSQRQTALHVEIWGNADIETPDVNMNVSAGGNVNCGGNIQGNVSAGASVNCDTVEGHASAGSKIKCDTIEGNASAGCSISCNTIEGDASAGTISCETIEGSAKASSHIEYKNR